MPAFSGPQSGTYGPGLALTSGVHGSLLWSRRPKLQASWRVARSRFRQGAPWELEPRAPPPKSSLASELWVLMPSVPAGTWMFSAQRSQLQLGPGPDSVSCPLSRWSFPAGAATLTHSFPSQALPPLTEQQFASHLNRLSVSSSLL